MMLRTDKSPLVRLEIGRIAQVHHPTLLAAKKRHIRRSSTVRMTLDPQVTEFLTEHNKHPVAWDTVTATQARSTANTTLK